MALVNDREHDRGYSFTAVLTPNERFSFDLGYTYSDIYFQMLECWAYGSGVTFPVAPGLLPSGTITLRAPCPWTFKGETLPLLEEPSTTAAKHISPTLTFFGNRSSG